MPAKRKNTTASSSSSGGTAKRPKVVSTNLDFNLEWKEEGELKSSGISSLIYLDGADSNPSTKIAGFDIDSTIIRTKSGKKFATGRSDWVFFDANVRKKLMKLTSEGIKVVFFTNQAGIEKGNADLDTLKGKFEDIINRLGIPIQIYISTGNSQYRKPSAEMWHFMASNCNGGQSIDLTNSLYVGDAAGRAKDWMKGKPKDFSCTDRMFAANVGVSFYTPETFFQELPEAPFNWKSLDVEEFIESVKEKTPPTDLHRDVSHCHDYVMYM